MHRPTDRIAHTTAFVPPVVEHWLEREIAQWVHPMKDRSDERSYHGATSRSRVVDMSSANGLVGTGFASRYRLQPRAGF